MSKRGHSVDVLGELVAELSNLALRASDEYRAPLIGMLARLALAELKPKERARHLERASQLAATFAPDTVQLGLHVVEGQAGSTLRVELLQESVVKEGMPFRLSDRELELVFVLALHPRGLSRANLLDTIWPEEKAVSAARTLKTYISRLRTKFEDPAAIETLHDGYRLSPRVSVDANEIVGDVMRSRQVDILDRELEMRLEHHLRALSEMRTSRSRNWEWMVAPRESLRDHAREIATRLATLATSRGDYAGAMRYGRLLIQLDPFDEAAREVTIRAHLASGDRPSALQEYQQYRRVLLQELNLEPSAEIAQLVH
jgi:DNA-binding SARP family transcriptional activator